MGIHRTRPRRSPDVTRSRLASGVSAQQLLSERVLGLLALGAGAGMLPATGPGSGSGLLRLVAAAALIAAAALVLPFVAPPSPRD